MRFLLAVLLLTPLSAQEYKIAVVGLVHSHVWGHLPKMIGSSAAARLVGIAEPNAELIAEARKIAPDTHYYSEYQKMLDEQHPDIVWSFVENNRHLEVAKECARRKINVMFEKPLASTFAEAEEIRQLALKAGIQVLTNYQMAWWAANYTAKGLVDEGKIGKTWRLHGIVGHGGPGSEGPRSKYFFEWLTDPVKNGAGALMDFGCYNALWSLWYLGRPTKVFATSNHLRPDRFPKVEDNANIELYYPQGVGIFEASWDLPQSYQDLEVFGYAPDGGSGSVYMKNGHVELRKGRQSEAVKIDPLPADRAEPIAYMVSCLRNHKPVEGLVAMDINAQVIEIIDAAKESVRTGKVVELRKR
ncbi:MAG: Gfo/Idh/MocA family oxidoreductase [Acidobacteriaceae bacterium]|nr:Gfo/Idh/MocA family oxidoreductase [Acidobacteriaceae bacterium]